MNGDYKIDKETFIALDTNKQNWMMFKTFNSYRENCDLRMTKTEESVTTLATQMAGKKKLDTAVSGATGLLGGFLAVSSVLIAKAMGWFK